MTAAQAAQQNNRGPGGRYKEKAHSEVEVDLSDVDHGPMSRVSQVVLRDDVVQVDLSSGERIEAAADGRMRLAPDDGRRRRIVGERDMELRRLAQRDLGVLPGENPWETVSRLRAATLSPGVEDPVLAARERMVRDPEYQGALERLHEAGEHLRSRYGDLSRQKVQRVRQTHRLTGADDRTRERLHRGAAALREAEQALVELHQVPSVRELSEHLGMEPVARPEVVSRGAIDGVPVERLGDGTVLASDDQGRQVEVTDILQDYEYERRNDPQISPCIVPRAIVEPEHLVLSQDTEVATAQQQARARREWNQTVQTGAEGQVSYGRFIAEAGVRARVVDLDPATGRRRYRLATAGAGDQTISASLYRSLDKVPEANTELGAAEVELGAETESVRRALNGEAGPELERALARQQAAAERLRRARQVAAEANARLLQRRGIRLQERLRSSSN